MDDHAPNETNIGESSGSVDFHLAVSPCSYDGNFDWEATCLIYNNNSHYNNNNDEDKDASVSSAALAVRTEYFRVYSAAKNDDDQGETLDLNNPSCSNDRKENLLRLESLGVNNNGNAKATFIGVIEFPILMTRRKKTFYAQQELLFPPNHYRFWTLCGRSPNLCNQGGTTTATPEQEESIASSPALWLKLVFSYVHELDDRNDYENDAMIGDEYGDGNPISVVVSLSPATPYPESWPVDDKPQWFQWLQEKADQVLEEQLTSFSVCNYLEHHALDFFKVIPLSKETDHFVVFFPPSSKHWQPHIHQPPPLAAQSSFCTLSTMPQSRISVVDSIVFNPLATRHGKYDLVYFNARDGTKTPITPAQLWPKKFTKPSLAVLFPKDTNSTKALKSRQQFQDNQHFTNLISAPTNQETHPSALAPRKSSTDDCDEGENENWWLHPCILHHEKWLPRSCPICLEDDFVAHDMAQLDCKHYVCQDCFTQYASIQVQELSNYRLGDNPFKCPLPSCRQGLRVNSTVKPFLSTTDMGRVKAWYYQLKHPVSKFLPQCLSCPNGEMRKAAIDAIFARCSSCGEQRCEYCIGRIPRRDCKNDRKDNVSVNTSDISTNKNDCDEVLKQRMDDHLSTTCNGAKTLKLARRYWRASKELQEQCEAKYPWIKVYAEARVGNAVAIREWLDKKEGQVCPVCSHGVVRTEGCFHIHCSCGAHFCYECGEELFPPFYGTHHCWENR